MSDGELPARLAIESQYARLSVAVRNKDLDAIRALHASGYRELQITGEERDLAEVMAEWRGDLSAMIEPSFQTEIHNFDLDGDQANVTVSSVQAFISSPSASQRFSNRIETTRRDSWINTGVGWCLSRSERQAIKSWIDGKLDRETTFEPLLKAEQRAAVVRDLCAHVLPFRSVLAGNGFDDEALFQETGVPRFILDLRDLPKDSAVGAWLAKPRLHRSIGAVYDPDRASNYYEHVRLPEMYDCIVFIAESTSAKIKRLLARLELVLTQDDGS